MKLYTLNGALKSMSSPVEISKFCNMTSNPFCAQPFICNMCYPKHKPATRVNIKMQKRTFYTLKKNINM